MSFIFYQPEVSYKHYLDFLQRMLAQLKASFICQLTGVFYPFSCRR